MNPDVERFLKEQAIDFAKKEQAVTYLLISLEDEALLGYFSITVKPLVVSAEPFSNTMRRKLARFSNINQEEQTYNMAAYLIVQLGKNFNEKVAGSDRLGKKIFHYGKQLYTLHDKIQFWNIYFAFPAILNYVIALVVEISMTFMAYEILKRIPIIRYFVLGIKKPKQG